MEIIDDKYRIENRKIGSGGFADVFLGTDLLTDNKVAIKRVHLHQKASTNSNILKKLQIETDLMARLDHPNIVKFYDLIKTRDYWYIIMELCVAGTLSDVIEYHNEKARISDSNFDREVNTWYYLDQLASSLDYLRKVGYTHRDIKPANILITVEQNNQFDSNDPNRYGYQTKLVLKLADFGLAKSYADQEQSLVNTICGSPLYMAPELFISKQYDSKIDIWAFGVIMYQMLFGMHPYGGTTYQQLVSNLKNKKVNFFIHKNFTPSCFDLVTNALVTEPTSRIDWPNMLNHEWFEYWRTNVDTDSSLKRNTNASIPIKINRSSFSDFPDEPSPTFSDQIGLQQQPVSVLGPSNLSRMKIDSNLMKSYVQGTYSDYPSSYPPPVSAPISITSNQNKTEQHYGTAPATFTRLYRSKSKIFQDRKSVNEKSVNENTFGDSFDVFGNY